MTSYKQRKLIYINYDEEEQSINFHVKEIAKGWSKALVNGMRLKNHR